MTLKMKRVGQQAGQWAVRILCALTLVCVGFAHQVPTLASAEDGFSRAELAQYVLPDGTLPTLCVTVTDDSGQSTDKPQHAHKTGCEACRISASVLLPQPTDTVGAHAGFVVTVELPRREEAFRRQLFPPNTGPRAPPSDLIAA